MQKILVRSRIVRTAGIMALAGSLMITAACGGKEKGGSETAEALSGPADTVALYRSNCISCHGAGLEGKMDANSDLRSVGSRLTKAQIASQITNGGSLMPVMKDRLSAEEIDALAAWLAAKQ